MSGREAWPRNYLGQHWRGNLSLAQAYWVNATFGVAILSTTAAFAHEMLIEGFAPPRFAAGSIIFLSLTTLLLTIWGLVGVWRSARRHHDRGGQKFWALMAQLMVLLDCVGTGWQLFVSVIPQTHQNLLLAVDRDPLGRPARATVSSDGRTVNVRGILAQGSAERLAAALERAPRAQYLVLHSPGGRVSEGRRMARLARERRIATRVEELCASACTVILVAGSSRSARADARIGFHQPDFVGLTATTRRELNRRLRELYSTAGIAPEFITKVLSYPPDQMWYPSHDEMIASGVLTQASTNRSR